jgi:hypothetical protein
MRSCGADASVGMRSIQHHVYLSSSPFAGFRRGISFCDWSFGKYGVLIGRESAPIAVGFFDYSRATNSRGIRQTVRNVLSTNRT